MHDSSQHLINPIGQEDLDGHLDSEYEQVIRSLVQSNIPSDWHLYRFYSIASSTYLHELLVFTH